MAGALSTVQQTENPQTLLQTSVGLKKIAGDLDGTVVQSVAVVPEETGELKKIHLADSPAQRTSCVAQVVILSKIHALEALNYLLY